MNRTLGNTLKVDIGKKRMGNRSTLAKTKQLIFHDYKEVHIVQISRRITKAAPAVGHLAKLLNSGYEKST